jgi:hypothetical protein
LLLRDDGRAMQRLPVDVSDQAGNAITVATSSDAGMAMSSVRNVLCAARSILRVQRSVGYANVGHIHVGFATMTADYSEPLLQARDLLQKTWDQAALGNIGLAQATCTEALIAVAKVRDALREMQEKQNSKAEQQGGTSVD